MVKQLSHKLWCKGMRHHPLLPSNIWYPDLNNSLAFFAFCCAAGFKLRKRQITNEPTGGPGNCPHLVEAVPCDDPSCYNWQLVGLDQCVPDEEKPCGSGTQLAQVGCVNSNGKINKSNSLSSSAWRVFCWICCSQLLLVSSSFSRFHLLWGARLTLYDKSYCIFSKSPPPDPRTVAAALQEEITVTGLINFLPRLLSLPPLNLSYFNACLIWSCQLSHAVSLITVFLSARTIKSYFH